ncbi:uncharacterized protein [Montipora capricornis]|uniref:uncharacterized protein n=1 Tax=Montipora capricornis TaxID=246305 RepID=UPI0035F205CD
MGQNICTSNSVVDDKEINMKTVSLVSHKMLKSLPVGSLSFLESKKQAKHLFEKFAETGAKDLIEKGRQKHGMAAPTKTKVVLGSEGEIYSLPADCGMFAAVSIAYSYHYNLRTSPDDWWFCVIKRVAYAIDANAKKESVRKMFVDHKGKKDITVFVEERDILKVDYEYFFDEITKGIRENVKVPEFVDGTTADFSTTTPVLKIVSQITLMYSVKEYFNYGKRMGCGIPAVEMLGTEEDWAKLTSKLKVLRSLLEPIEKDLGLDEAWWNVVQEVFHNLLKTYQGKPDRKWWSHIVDYQTAYSSGFLVGRNIKGWITEFLLGNVSQAYIKDEGDFTSGLVSVPIDLTDVLSDRKDTAALVGGMLGFTVHGKSVQPFQGWTLVLGEDSPFL